MSYSFGDVVLVTFPFTNLRASKKRPAVVVSSNKYHQTRPDVILMAITSQIKGEPASDEALLQDWKTAGLVKPSLLKPVLATLEQRSIVRTMGQLSYADRNQLYRILDEIVGDKM